MVPLETVRGQKEGVVLSASGNDSPHWDFVLRTLCIMLRSRIRTAQMLSLMDERVGEVKSALSRLRRTLRYGEKGEEVLMKYREFGLGSTKDRRESLGDRKTI